MSPASDHPPEGRGASVYITLDDEALVRQCEVMTFRGTGPGGQKRNKTESAVRLRHRPTGVTAQSDDTRSQHKNKKSALTRLRRRLALELRAPVSLTDFAPPPELARLVKQRGGLGKSQPEYLVAVAALLDLLVACDGSVKDAAAALKTTTGGLVKILVADAELKAAANALRAERGIGPLR